MCKIIISGSVDFKNEIEKWKDYLEKKGYDIVDSPSNIENNHLSNKFDIKYTNLLRNYFKNLNRSDVMFVVNEDKDGYVGYVGNSVFGEMNYFLGNNLIKNYHKKIVLLQKPDHRLNYSKEIRLWMKIGWIKLYEDFINKKNSQLFLGY